MSENYREQLFANYHRTHAAYLDMDDQEKIAWFRLYAERNYLPHLATLNRESATLLEIGCGKGYLLANMSNFGFKQLYGVDMSPDDIEKAKVIAPAAAVVCGDAFEYLENTPNTFDVIVIKAVLEHTAKDRVLPFLERIRNALKPNGLVIVDVPNMDWLFAQHERYMDFTHEVGFTRESLAQVMRNVFDQVSVHSGLLAEPATTLVGKVKVALRPHIITAFSIFLKFVGEGAVDVWWYSRSIVGVGRKAS